jgi:hypothetical protein|tara:strand:+ start:598 stop:747 length:150 start_codon:yes stop_codon:yes gene_type:complete
MLTLLAIDLFKMAVATFLLITVVAIFTGRTVEWLEYLGLAPTEGNNNED